MLLLDVNVVLIAYRPDHPIHAEVRSWFDELVESGDMFGIPMQVWASFLRLVTNRRVFPDPTTIDEAFDFIAAVRSRAGHVPAEPGPRHLTILRAVCDEAGITGELVPDAVLAAIAIENGATVVSLDRDFARFSSVRQLRPLAPPPGA